MKTLTNKRNTAHLISRYETVQFSDLYHFVRFWHKAMDHADIKTMLLVANRIVSHPSEFRGFPREFTPAIIRKHFPVTCHSCPLGNLYRRPSIVATDASTPREILSGEKMEIDIQGKVSDSTGRPSPSFSDVLYWIVAECRATGLLWGKTLKTRKDLFRHLDRLHKWITSRGKVLKVIRSDNEFVTAVVTDWLPAILPL